MKVIKRFIPIIYIRVPKHASSMKTKYLAAAKNYRMQVNKLHAMIFVCRDPAHIKRMRAQIEENERLAKSRSIWRLIIYAMT